MQFQKGNAESRMVMKDSGQDITRSLRSSKEGRVMEVLASNRHQAGPHPPPVRRRIIVTNGASQFFLFTPAQLKEQREQDSAISSPYFSGEGLGGGTFKNHLDYLGRIPKRIGDTCAKLPASFRNFMGQSMDKVVRFRQQATTEEQEEQRGDLNIFSTICENRTYNPSVSDNSDEREGKCESPAPVGVHANMIDNNDPDPKFSSSSLSPPANLRRMEEGWEESDSLGEAAAKSLPNAVAKRILTVVRKATSLTLGDLVDYIKRGRQEQEDGGTAEEGSNATISTSLSTDAADYIKTENGRSVEHSYKGSSSTTQWQWQEQPLAAFLQRAGRAFVGDQKDNAESKKSPTVTTVRAKSSSSYFLDVQAEEGASVAANSKDMEPRKSLRISTILTSFAVTVAFCELTMAGSFERWGKGMKARLSKLLKKRKHGQGKRKNRANDGNADASKSGAMDKKHESPVPSRAPTSMSDLIHSL